MTNITRVRQDERLMKIGVIRQSLLKAEDPDIEKLVMFCCAEWGISERTAREYIKIARFKIDNEKEKADTDVKAATDAKTDPK